MDSAKITQTFNGRAEWLVQGSYFKLMSTVNPVNVKLFMSGRVVHQADTVEGGHYQRVDFDRVEITTSANEAVSWLYAPKDGGTDRVMVAGTLGQIAQALVGGINTLVISSRGFVYSTSVKSSTVINTGATEQVFAAASNPNGCMLWDCEINSAAISNTLVALHAHTAAPAAFTDGDMLLVLASNLATAVGQVSLNTKMRDAVFVPAGKGLWYRNSGAGNEALGSRRVLYTLL